MMKIRIKKKEADVILLFLVALIIYLIAFDLIGLDSGSLDNIRYFAFIIAIGYGYLVMHGRGILLMPKYQFGADIKYIYIVAILLYALSLVQAYRVGYPLHMRTYIQIALILIPAMYSFVLVNLLHIKTITVLFEVVLVLNILFYIFVDKGIGTFLDFNNYQLISFSDSYSPFESQLHWHELFACFAYFNFFRNTAENSKERVKYNVFWILSIVFTLLSFKRLSVVFVFVVLIVEFFVDLYRKLPKYLPIVTAAFFTISTYFYSQFMQGHLFPGVNLYILTKGRDYILSLWASKGYLSYGYGSSYVVIDRYLEMDLVQMYMEVGLIAVFAFSYAYFKISSTNLYTYVLMLYVFGNLLTASSLPWTMGFVLIMITILCISSSKLEKENITVRTNKWKMKFFKEARYPSE